MGRTLEFAIRIAGRIERSVGTAFTNAQRQIDKLQGAANAMSNALAVGSATVGGAAVKATKELLDLGGAWQTATNQVSAATGATGAELEELRDIMEAVYANNFGDGLDDIVDTLALVDNNMGNLPKEEFQTATESAIALRDALGYDAEETIRAAEALRKNFGKSAEQAFGMIAAGAQNGLDYSGELLDTISEYSSQFAKLGFDANGMFHLLQSGADSTAWNLDKVGDAIKEFSIRAIDGSDTTVAAFRSLGFNAQTMMTTIAGGGDAANKAFYDILDSLLAVEDQVKRDSIGVSLFGTMWEDLGVEAMTALSQTSDAAYDAVSALAQINAVKYNDLDSVLEGLRRKLELSMLPAADALYQSLLNEMPQLEAAMDEVAPILGELAGDFASDAAGFVAENLPSFVQAIQDLVQETKTAYQEVKPLLSFLWENKKAVLGVVAGLRILGPTLNGVSTAFTALNNIKTYSALFVTWAKATSLLTIAKIKDKAETVAIYGLLAKDAVMRAKDTAATIANTAAVKASSIARKAGNGVSTAASFAVSAAVKAKDTTATIANTAAVKASNIARKAGNGVSTAASFVVSTAAKAKDTAATIANTVAVKTSTIARMAGNGVNTAASFVVSTAAKVKDTAVTGAHTSATTVNTVAQKAATVASYTLGTAIKFATGPMGLAVTAIMALITAGVLLYQNWDTIKARALELWDMFSVTFPGAAAVVGAWGKSILAAVDNVKAIFNNIIDFINNVFAGNWTGAWQNIVNIFGNLFGMLGNLAKAPINAVISAINYIIGQINSLSFTVPDWVPGDLAGQTFGFALPTIPQLAKGGIATSATLAEIGEGSEPEAVLPLSKLAQLLKQYTGTNPPKDNKPTENGNSVIQFAPVFHFYGNVTKEEAVEAGRLSFVEFKRLYKQMKEEEKRKKFAPV